MYENYCKIRDAKGYRDADVVRATGITKSTFSDWKSGRSCPKNEKLQKIANFLGVTLDYLLTGEETAKPQAIELTPKDERDIANDLENIRRKLMNQESGPAAFNGQILSKESADLLLAELDISLRRLKILNKEKYNPNKNKK